MPIKKYKPTTPSRRAMTNVDYSGLSKVKPKKSLLKGMKRHAGRNSAGRITVRHQGGGNKRRYRMVDFKRTEFLGEKAVVESIEYNPFSTCFIALIKYESGKYSYILAPHGLKEGDSVVSDKEVLPRLGNRMELGNIPQATRVYNIEFNTGQGGKIARSAGQSAEVQSHEAGYTNVKMPSGEVRKFISTCFASVGELSNPEHNLVVIGKAGRNRWLGKRPTVRGSAMNAVDHPYGGGEGRQPRGTRRPKDKWGNVTGGRKTRKKKKPSTKLIIRHRNSKKR